MKSSYVFTAAALLAGLMFSTPDSWACVVCGLDDSAYVVSYIFMLGMPLSLMGAIGGVFVYSSWRRKNNSSDT
jgi:hypothetical protein